MLTPERSCHGGSARKIHITATYHLSNCATSQARLFLPNCSPTNGTYHSVDATGGRRDGVLRVPPHTCGSRACEPGACDPHVRARVRSASDISPCPLRPTFALLVRTPLVYRMPVPKQYRGALESTVLSRSSSIPTALSNSPALCLYTTALSARSAVRPVPTRCFLSDCAALDCVLVRAPPTTPFHAAAPMSSSALPLPEAPTLPLPEAPTLRSNGVVPSRATALSERQRPFLSVRGLKLHWCLRL
jgi:hypothetical protein